MFSRFPELLPGIVFSNLEGESVQELEASDPTLSGIGDFRIGHDTAEIFRIRPDNIFQLKLSYWLNP